MPAPYKQGVRRAHRTSITRSCTACPSGPRHRGRRTRGTLVWHHVRANACIRRAYSAPLENTKNVTGSRCPGLRGLDRPPGPMALLSAGQPGQRPVSPGQRRSALADPGHRRLRLTGRKVLAITPGAAGAVVVMALPAWNADHAPIFSLSLLRHLLAALSSPGMDGCQAPVFSLLPQAGRNPRRGPVLAGTGLRRGLRDWLDVCDGLRYREEADGQACQAALARRIRRRRSAARSSSFRPPHTPYFSGRDSA